MEQLSFTGPVAKKMKTLCYAWQTFNLQLNSQIKEQIEVLHACELLITLYSARFIQVVWLICFHIFENPEAWIILIWLLLHSNNFWGQVRVIKSL